MPAPHGVDVAGDDAERSSQGERQRSPPLPLLSVV
jgi:hypothetical protein